MEAKAINITNDDYPSIQCFVPGGKFQEVPFILLEPDAHPDVKISFSLLFNWIEQRVAEGSREKGHRFTYIPAQSLEKIFKTEGILGYTIDDIVQLPIQSGTLLFEDGLQMIYALIEEATTRFWFGLPGRMLAVAELDGGVSQNIEIARLDKNFLITAHMHAVPRLTTGDLLTTVIPFVRYINQYPPSLTLSPENNSTSATIYELS